MAPETTTVPPVRNQMPGDQIDGLVAVAVSEPRDDQPHGERA